MIGPDDQKAIDRVRSAIREAVLGRDAEAYAACFAEDAFLMHQDTPYVHGTRAIMEHTRQVFQVAKVTKLELSSLVVDGAEGFAYEVGVQEVAVDPPVDAFKSRRKHLHVYCRQADGEWRIAAAMSCND